MNGRVKIPNEKNIFGEMVAASVVKEYRKSKREIASICNLLKIEVSPKMEDDFRNDIGKKIKFYLENAWGDRNSVDKINKKLSFYFETQGMDNFSVEKILLLEDFHDFICENNFRLTDMESSMERIMRAHFEEIFVKKINECCHFKSNEFLHSYRSLFSLLICNNFVNICLDDGYRKQYKQILEDLFSSISPDKQISQDLPMALQAKVDLFQKFVDADSIGLLRNNPEKLKHHVENSPEKLLECMIRIHGANEINKVFFRAVFSMESVKRQIDNFIKYLDKIGTRLSEFSLDELHYEIMSFKGISKDRLSKLYYFLGVILQYNVDENDLHLAIDSVCLYSDVNQLKQYILPHPEKTTYEWLKQTAYYLKYGHKIEEGQDNLLVIEDMDENMFNEGANESFYSRLMRRAPHRLKEAVKFSKECSDMPGKSSVKQILLKRDRIFDSYVQELINFFRNYQGNNIELIDHIFSLSSSFPIDRFMKEILFNPEKLDVFERNSEIIKTFAHCLIPEYPLGTILFHSMHDENELNKLIEKMELINSGKMVEQYQLPEITQSVISKKGNDQAVIPGLKLLKLDRVDDPQDEFGYFIYLRFGMLYTFYQFLEDKYEKHHKKIHTGGLKETQKEFYSLRATTSSSYSPYLRVYSSSTYRTGVDARYTFMSEEKKLLGEIQESDYLDGDNKMQNIRGHISFFPKYFIFGNGLNDAENNLYFLGLEMNFENMISSVQSTWHQQEVVNGHVETIIRPQISRDAEAVLSGNLTASQAFYNSLMGLNKCIKNNHANSKQFLTNSIEELMKIEKKRRPYDLILEQGAWKAYYRLISCLLENPEKRQSFMQTFNNSAEHDPVDWTLIKAKYMPDKLPTDRNLSFCEKVSLPYTPSDDECSPAEPTDDNRLIPQYEDLSTDDEYEFVNDEPTDDELSDNELTDNEFTDNEFTPLPDDKLVTFQNLSDSAAYLFQAQEEPLRVEAPCQVYNDGSMMLHNHYYPSIAHSFQDPRALRAGAFSQTQRKPLKIETLDGVDITKSILGPKPN